jgi:hypothetical protein
MLKKIILKKAFLLGFLGYHMKVSAVNNPTCNIIVIKLESINNIQEVMTSNIFSEEKNLLQSVHNSGRKNNLESTNVSDSSSDEEKQILQLTSSRSSSASTDYTLLRSKCINDISPSPVRCPIQEQLGQFFNCNINITGYRKMSHLEKS